MAESTPSHAPQNSGKPEKETSISSPGRKPLPFPLEEIAGLFRGVWGVAGPFLKDVGAFGRWCRREPVSAGALGAIAVVLVFFYGILRPFSYGAISVARWAWEAWDPSGEQSYGMLVPVIAIWLFYHHRRELAKAAPGGYGLGLLPLAFGIVMEVLAVRCLNPRMALASIPFLLYGAVRFGWGRAASRVVLFPCAFLIFMMPVAALEQATNNLQFIITGAVGKLTHLMGIAILAVGTTLTATDGSFNFEIAEGCSGIRSLTAMTMLTAVFVHLTQDRLWKKILIFGCSLGFALIGNIGRIFSIVLLARFYDPKVAAGVYHEYSGFLFFPIAILAMLLMSQVVNWPSKRNRGPAAKATSLSQAR